MTRPIFLAVAALLTASGLFATTATASMIPIYANPLSSNGTRAQVHKTSGDNCQRRGTDTALRIQLGERTQSCSMSPPVVGRDLAVTVVGRVLSGTPNRLRNATYLSAGIRTGEGGSIEARVFPAQRRLQVVKNRPDGSRAFIAVTRDSPAIRGLNQGNRIFISAINTAQPGVCRVVVRVNARRLAAENTERCAELQGREIQFGVGAARGGPGAVASFSQLQVSLPNPF